MPTLLCTIETNLAECEALWRKFSPDELFSDLWEYRLSFFEASGSTPYFMKCMIDEEIVGIVPLEFEPFYKRYMFFGGGDWVENSRFLIQESHKKKCLDEILSQIPTPHELLYIHTDEALYSELLVPEEPTYFLSPPDYEFDLERYFQAFSYKRRKNVRRDIKQLESRGARVLEGRFEDFETLTRLNLKQFAEDSSFDEGWFKKAFARIAQDKILMSYLRFKTIMLADKIVACGLYAAYNNRYTFLASGVDPDVSNVFKLLNFEIIREAFENRIQRIDFLTDECGWKKSWRLRTEMLYKLI